MDERKRVLILCTGNSARSQIAEGLLRDLAGGTFDVATADVSPSHIRCYLWWPRTIRTLLSLIRLQAERTFTERKTHQLATALDQDIHRLL